MCLKSKVIPQAQWSLQRSHLVYIIYEAVTTDGRGGLAGWFLSTRSEYSGSRRVPFSTFFELLLIVNEAADAEPHPAHFHDRSTNGHENAMVTYNIFLLPRPPLCREFEHRSFNFLPSLTADVKFSSVLFEQCIEESLRVRILNINLFTIRTIAI